MVGEVDVGPHRIGFRRAGTGPPLVLLHGGLCDSRVWRTQLEELSDQYTVVAWDAPGCGGSSDPPDGFGLGDYAECLAGFIDTLGLDRPHVLGHSFGGGLALELYRRHSGLVRSLVLAAGYAGWAGSLPAEEVQARLHLALRQADGLPVTITADAVRSLVGNDLDARQLEELAIVMSDVRAVGVRRMARAFAEADLRDVLSQVAVPTLLLSGSADERAPRHVWEDLHDAIRTSSLVVLPGVGHELFLEAPDQFNVEVRRFLEPSDP